MTEIEVRPAAPSDMTGLVDSLAALFAEDAGTRDPTIDVDYPHHFGVQGFNELADDPSRLLLIAAVNGQIVGHLTGRFDGPSPIVLVGVATLASMYVRPVHRGTGIGARLVETFRAWARDKGAGRMTVTAYTTNEGATRFYQRQGFAPKSTVFEASP
jgi:GNAT superfamily N-acetyltransferase